MNMINMYRKKTTEEFIKEAQNTHGDKFDYSKVNYVNAKTKVCIICPKHGNFNMIPKNHVIGQGCPKCAGRGKTTESIIKEFKIVHGDKYDYSNTEYITYESKLSIICPEHGEFWQSYNKHVEGYGCHVCGEIKRKKNVTNNKLSKKFKGLVQPEEYKLIPLTQGKFAKVDNEDFDRLKDINWCYDGHGYAINKEFGKMHRYIMRAPAGKAVDHINHNKTDNRKNNLRIATYRQNSFNSRPRYKSSSKYKGVSWHKDAKKWSTSIKWDEKKIHLGLFKDEREAAEAYDKKALELFGEFAYLNFPELQKLLNSESND